VMLSSTSWQLVEKALRIYTSESSPMMTVSFTDDITANKFVVRACGILKKTQCAAQTSHTLYAFHFVQSCIKELFQFLLCQVHVFTNLGNKI